MAAARLYGELLANPAPERSLMGVLKDADVAVVVFDGISLREIPMLRIVNSSA